MTADQIKAIEEFAGRVMRYYTKVGGGCTLHHGGLLYRPIGQGV